MNIKKIRQLLENLIVEIKGTEKGVIERWAFSKSELKNPKKLNSNDELVANITSDMSGLEDEVGVIVYRNGTVTNRFDDGTVGVSDELQKIASEVEILYHPETNEETIEWRDVFVDDESNFIDFA